VRFARDFDPAESAEAANESEVEVSRSFELDPVTRITAGAIGEPGERTFFVQASAPGEEVSLIFEKEQVRALAQGLLQLLAALPGEEPDDPGIEPSELDLQAPLEPEWRAGEMAIEYEQEIDRIVITIREAQLEDDEEQAEEDGATARFVATRTQARAMAAHALDVVAAGRPRCQLCGMPINEGEEHVCPAMNGHRK
jgi:uncharacterized repeat protein (TIGR03847 family)